MYTFPLVCTLLFGALVGCPRACDRGIDPPLQRANFLPRVPAAAFARVKHRRVVDELHESSHPRRGGIPPRPATPRVLAKGRVEVREIVSAERDVRE